jgi:hypothetical protein
MDRDILDKHQDNIGMYSGCKMRHANYGGLQMIVISMISISRIIFNLALFAGILPARKIGNIKSYGLILHPLLSLNFQPIDLDKC